MQKSTLLASEEGSTSLAEPLAPSVQSEQSTSLLPPGIREIESLVEATLASWHTSSQILQCRRWHRIPFEKPLVLAILDDRTGDALGQSMLVDGRDISLGGISFQHSEPLPYRKVAFTLFRPDRPPEWVAIRLTWCRFILGGGYHSGGPFVTSGDFSLNFDIDWDELRRA